LRLVRRAGLGCLVQFIFHRVHVGGRRDGIAA
jgi:hypothetical protein